MHKDIFENDANALSEDGKGEGVYAEEYEVFQILFWLFLLIVIKK